MIFINRDKELQILRLNTERIKKGTGEHLAMIGLRRIGKTSILKRYMEEFKNDPQVLLAYIDIQRIISSPEIFAQRYFGTIAYHLFLKMNQRINIEEFFNPTTLFSKTAEIESNVLTRYARGFLEELSKRRIDRNYLLNLAFSFPQELAEEKKMQAVILLDEFQDIIGLNAFEQIESILSIMLIFTHIFYWTIREEIMLPKDT